MTPINKNLFTEGLTSKGGNPDNAKHTIASTSLRPMLKPAAAGPENKPCTPKVFFMMCSKHLICRIDTDASVVSVKVEYIFKGSVVEQVHHATMEEPGIFLDYFQQTPGVNYSGGKARITVMNHEGNIAEKQVVIG